MIKALITCTVIIIIIIGLIKKNKRYRRNYSLGLEVAEEVQILIKNKNYAKAEEKTQNQDINDITQIIDHLALSLEEHELLAWRESKQSDLSKLSLGVFYLHLAWIARSHKFAKNVSEKKAESFFDYLLLCETTFKSIATDSLYTPELTSRKIRLYMSLGNESLASKCFHTISTSYPDFIFPYIHYCELIQPKWGGDIKDIETLYENLPNNFLIQSIVELKLIHDATIMNDNYFLKYTNSIHDFAFQKISKIDDYIKYNPVQSIHKYMLYNYMEAVSNTINQKHVRNKYKKMMDDNYTMYPYGVLS